MLLLACLSLASPGARADQAMEDKLRDLVRQTTEQLRAAQDAQAGLQAQVDSLTKQRDALQAQVADLQAKPAAPAVNPQQAAALKAAEATAAAAQAQVAQYQAGLDKWQKAYQQAASLAQAKNAADQKDAAALKLASAQLGICKTENGRLITLGTDILHLYQTPKWNRLLVASHEPLIGFWKVKLENEVQDYEDKLDAQSYVPPPAGR